MATTAGVSGEGQEEVEEEEFDVRFSFLSRPFEICLQQQRQRLQQEWEQQQLLLARREEVEAEAGQEEQQAGEQDWTVSRRGTSLGFGMIIGEPGREEEEGRNEYDDVDVEDLGQPTNSSLTATIGAVDDRRRVIESAQVMVDRRREERMRNRLDNGRGQEGRMDWRIVAEEQISGERNRLENGGGEEGRMDWRIGEELMGGESDRLENGGARREERRMDWRIGGEDQMWGERNNLGIGEGAGGQEGRAVKRKPRVGDHPGSILMNHSEEGHLATTMMLTSDYSYSCKLPDHLIESVLARLPLQSIFRFRSVCRTWNSLLYSPTFLMAYSETAIRHSVWFLLPTANLERLSRYGHRVVAAYDPQCNNWHRIPLPAPLCNLNPYPTAADGGLVCYFVYENRLRTLFVCNPLTKSLRKLPHVLKTCSHISVLKMVMDDRATSSYKVFVAGMVPGENGNDSLNMEVYDSATDCWITSGIIPARYPRKRPVYDNGVLYVRCSDQRSSLLTFDLKARVWTKIHAPLPHTLGIEELVQYEGHILLVGVLGENYKIDSVCIWELVQQQQQNSRNLAWKQVDSMPRDMFMEFLCDWEYFQCQEDERVLMKCCQYGDLILCVAFSTLPRGPFRVIAYDLAQRRWRRLPDSFKVRECRTHKFMEGLIYEPRLDVTA